jgi:trehalose-6-phosphate synthase
VRALVELLKHSVPCLQGCVPVFLDEQTVDQYYNGYCNNVLWPLFHYIGLPTEDRLAATRSLQSQWAAYKSANEQFADTVLSQYQVRALSPAGAWQICEMSDREKFL